MYELTCPSCLQARQSPFVRVGAVATCPKCGQRFQVQEEHFKRLQPAPAQSSDPLLTPQAERPAPPVLPTPHLSPARQRQSITQQDMFIEELSKLDGAMDEPVESIQRPSAPTPRPRRAPSRMYHVSIAVLSMAILAALGIAVATGRIPLIARSKSKQPSGANAPSTPVVIHSRIPRLPAERLAVPLWQPVDEQHVPFKYKGPIQLTDQNLKWTLERGWSFDALVATQGQAVFESVMIEIVLTDRNARAYARVEVPVVLVNSRPQPIHLPISKELKDRRFGADWRVTANRPIEDAVALDPQQIQVERFGSGPETELRLTAYNRSGKALRGLVFQVSALDGANGALVQWRTTWPEAVQPGQGVQFTMPAPLEPSWQIERFRVVAAGVPATPATTPATGDSL